MRLKLEDERHDLLALQRRLDPLPDSPADRYAENEGMLGDHDLNPASSPVHGKALRPAAVLVPLVARGGGWTVLLTRRPAHMRKHAGQISFPGGRMEEEDESIIVTALRECEEEIGLDRRHVEVMGALKTYVTVTNYAVTPVVGFVRPPFAMKADPGEVDEIFEVPFDFLMDRANHRRHGGYLNGVRRYWHAVPYGDYYIWGATAGMLMDLFDRLGDPPVAAGGER